MTNGAPDRSKKFRQPSVFVAYSFGERDKWIRHCVPPLLRLYGCDVKTGEEYFAQGISDAVTADIARSNLLIAFLTRVHRLTNGMWAPSQWVLQEVGFARGKGIPVVLICEKGVFTETGILGDVQVIDLDADREAFAAFTHLRGAIRKLLFKGQPDDGLAICHLAKRGRLDHWSRQWWDVWVWISGSEKKLESITQVHYKFPPSFYPKLEEGDRHGAFGDYLETDSPIMMRAQIRSRSGRPPRKQTVKHKITLTGAGYTVI